MEYATKELFTSFGSPSGEGLPNLIVVHSKTGWDRFVSGYAGSESKWRNPAVDWSTEVALIVQAPPEGGTVLVPRLISLVRQGHRVEVRAGMRNNPGGGDTDVELLPQLIASAPAVAFAGDPEIDFELEHQGRGTARHEH